MNKIEKGYRNDVIFDKFLLVIAGLHIGYSLFDFFQHFNFISFITYILVGSTYPILRYSTQLTFHRRVKYTLITVILIFGIHLYIHLKFFINSFSEFIFYYNIGFLVILIFSLNIKPNNQSNRKIFLYFLFSLIFVGIPASIIYNDIYRPWKWIKECTIGYYLTGDEKTPKKVVKSYCECRYAKFKINYDKIKYFPTECDYTEEDKYDMFNCIIDYLMDDTSRLRHRSNIHKYVESFNQDLKEKCD